MVNNIKIKLDGKLMRLSSQTKYLGMLIDENLTMEKQKGAISSKLGKANGALSYLYYAVFTTRFFNLIFNMVYKFGDRI